MTKPGSHETFGHEVEAEGDRVRAPIDGAPFLIVLGIAQDGGVPQAGCSKPCCRAAWSDPARRRLVASMGLVDPQSSLQWLIDATPDFREQLRRLQTAAGVDSGATAARVNSGATAGWLGLAGIFLSHGHVGHYLGLAQLGREVLGARYVQVHVMPRMRALLERSSPWDQLVLLGNASLQALQADVPVSLTSSLSVTPFLVPHRAETTETVGFRIRGPRRTVIYLPDIDSWETWTVSLELLLAEVDLAYLDGTFYDEGELPARREREVPHPRIADTLRRLAPLPTSERGKVRFLHLNHTNPALDPGSVAARSVIDAGAKVAEEGERVEL